MATDQAKDEGLHPELAQSEHPPDEVSRATDDNRPTVTCLPAPVRRSRPMTGQLMPYASAPPWAIFPSSESQFRGPFDPNTRDLPRRYLVGREIGRGGQGRVLTVFDTELGRPVALKTVLAGPHANEAAWRIIHEVQTTGQLEHPNIVPVYDMGLLAGGEVFFTMKLVDGRTLAEVLKGLAASDPVTQETYSRLRLIHIMLRVCQGIAFAHDRGVVHRDLKPSNIMLGAYGEITILDWGCAKVRGDTSEMSYPDVRPVVTTHSQSVEPTIAGTVQGTPSYMSPEQAAGREVDERTDVYALGAILYEILTGFPPIEGADVQARLEAVLQSKVIPPRLRAPEREIPVELEQVCLRCLARHKGERYPSAMALHDALERYLEGTLALEQQQREAATLVEMGTQFATQYDALSSRLKELCSKVQQAALVIEPWHPVTRKRPLRELERQIAEAESEKMVTYGRAITAFHQALSHHPGNVNARQGLARLYWSEFCHAEARGDQHDMLYFEAMVREFDAGEYADALRGIGFLSLSSDPGLASVRLLPLSRDGQARGAVQARELGLTPLELVPLPRGSYLLELRRRGNRVTRFPILIERQQVQSHRVRLITSRGLGPEWVVVPAGPFISGGDPLASEGLERQVCSVSDYAILKYPVTFGQYQIFIESLAMENPEEALQRSPRVDIVSLVRALPDAGEQVVREAGQVSSVISDWPVFGVSWEDACAYARWLSLRTSLLVRLPTGLEWEKAARGVDGRKFPWGDSFDATYCKMWQSRPCVAAPEPVGTFPMDRSPYGVRDMAGCISEWTLDWFSEPLSLRLVKGGGWYATANQCRLVKRHGEHPLAVSPWIGFRLVSPL